ncbi:molybdopterin synthase sulfur carrier subunit [Larkinella arboricola]|uniref:Molybdopterin synthase sulfur carrier subunit n=1 Tax=Larkinella arboricola TaxID=643671 RepID=A0A327WSN0_LARAB|nr:molybdopterin converting factor subunit 1 [Larkinella arboricola]RAJ95463.1 molybdopterin synthase sulfur carrier subunit [Larkinella arboricola]
MSNRVSVLLFGITREIVGSPALTLDLPQTGQVGDLLFHLKEQYPALNGLRSLLVAVNGEYAETDQALRPNDEIALIPPVSGG